MKQKRLPEWHEFTDWLRRNGSERERYIAIIAQTLPELSLIQQEIEDDCEPRIIDIELIAQTWNAAEKLGVLKETQ